jgi:hypothetical protein
MRIYSDTLTIDDLYNLRAGIPLTIDAGYQVLQKPRIRAHGWRLSTSGGRNRWKNTGTHGASSVPAASWDDHGRWFARIMWADPEAVIVAGRRYNGRASFHLQTDNAYAAHDAPVPA